MSIYEIFTNIKVQTGLRSWYTSLIFMTGSCESCLGATELRIHTAMHISCFLRKMVLVYHWIESSKSSTDGVQSSFSF